jgi:hypothetical protein
LSPGSCHSLPTVTWRGLREGKFPMLFKHKQLLEELRKKGRRATAEIVAVKGYLDKLLEDHAVAAVECVRGHVTEFAPDLDPNWFARHDVYVIREAYGDITADAPHTALAGPSSA